MTDNNVFF